MARFLAGPRMASKQPWQLRLERTAGPTMKAAKHEDEEHEVDAAGGAMRPSSPGDGIAK